MHLVFKIIFCFGGEFWIMEEFLVFVVTDLSWFLNGVGKRVVSRYLKFWKHHETFWIFRTSHWNGMENSVNFYLNFMLSEICRFIFTSIPSEKKQGSVTSKCIFSGEVTRGVIPLICLLIFCTVQWVETS
jgi:hypothetical protein